MVMSTEQYVALLEAEAAKDGAAERWAHRSVDYSAQYGDTVDATWAGVCAWANYDAAKAARCAA